MTIADPTGRAILTLVASVRDDLSALERLRERLAEHLGRLGPEPIPQDVMAAAGYLHHIYTAMEAIDERIVTTIDGTRPSGEKWHQDLLAVAGIEIPGVRPALLRPETRGRLARLLRFRHFFRHAYRIDYLWAEVKPLVTDIDATVAAFVTDIESFCSHLLAGV